MRPITVPLMAAIVVAAGLAWSGNAWAQATITRTHDNIKEATVFGHWEYANSFGGTTFVDLIANEPAPGSTSTPFSSFSVVVTDANSNVVGGFIHIVESTISLTEAVDLSTARLQVTGIAQEIIRGDFVPYSIDLTFTATGALVDVRSHFHFVEPGSTVIDSHFDGQSRDATATGTLIVEGTNWTPVPSQTAQIQFNRTGAFFLQILGP